MLRICFVCLGNICRSPTAQGVMERLVRERSLESHIEIESAGTGSWHIGSLPDPRTRRAAQRRGYELVSRAQQFTSSSFARFDLVLAADTQNARTLAQLAPDDSARAKIQLLRAFDSASPRGASVPDPYEGGEEGFEEVLSICEAACAGLLAHLVEAAGPTFENLTRLAKVGTLEP
jgi:protein-tyrosine phosphatase